MDIKAAETRKVSFGGGLRAEDNLESVVDNDGKHQGGADALREEGNGIFPTVAPGRRQIEDLIELRERLIRGDQESFYAQDAQPDILAAANEADGLIGRQKQFAAPPNSEWRELLFDLRHRSHPHAR